MYALKCVANLLQLSLFFKKLSKLHDAHDVHYVIIVEYLSELRPYFQKH